MEHLHPYPRYARLEQRLVLGLFHILLYVNSQSGMLSKLQWVHVPLLSSHR